MRERIKEVVDDEYLSLLIDDILDSHPYEVRIKDNFNTAMWTFKKDKHYIFIGDSILDNAKDNAGSNHYIASYLHHEVGHSLFTEKNLESINYALNDFEIPFSLFNLAEDARIEHFMRENTERDFLWTKSEEVKTTPEPTGTLFYIIQNEGKYEPESETDELILDFYNKFITAKDSFEIIEVLVDWKKEFPNTQEETQNLQELLGEEGDNKALEDLKNSLEMQMSDKKFEEALSDSEQVIKVESEEKKEVEAESVMVEECSTGDLLRDEDDWDVQKSQEIAMRLEDLFKDKKKIKNSKRSSSRLNKKAFRVGSSTTKLYRKPTEESSSKEEVVLILDTSGSMGGMPIESMRIIIGAFNQLARQQSIAARVILTGVLRGNAIHQTFILPVDNSTIGKFQAFCGAEGIEDTMKKNIEYLKKASNVFVLTDGYISDNKISKELYHMEGIYTVGMYIGNGSIEHLSRWFDKAMVSETVEDCAMQLASLIRRG